MIVYETGTLVKAAGPKLLMVIVTVSALVKLQPEFGAVIAVTPASLAAIPNSYAPKSGVVELRPKPRISSVTEGTGCPRFASVKAVGFRLPVAGAVKTGSLYTEI